MAVGRGEGNAMHNRQEPSRNNLRNRQGTPIDEETLAMAQKNLERQQAIGFKKLDSTTLSHNNLPQLRNDLPAKQANEPNDSESQGHLGKRKKITKLSSRVAMNLQVDGAANPTPRENIRSDNAAVGRGEGNSMRNCQEPSRNNLRNRQGTPNDEETLAMAQKNLERQQAIGFRNLDSTTLSHNNLPQLRNDLPAMQANEPNDSESQGLVPSSTECHLGKRKRITKLSSRVAMSLQVAGAANPTPRENIRSDMHGGNPNGGGLTQLAVNGSTNVEATSKTTKKGSRGKYKSYVVDMKVKGKGSKLTIEIPEEIDRAIGENARHLVNECGRVVRTRAPLNVKSWQQAFSIAGESMWKEIQDKFQIIESSRHLKLYAFVVETMQRLYRLWKTRLHYYYKSAKCGKTDEERLKNPPPDLPQDQWESCVKTFGSAEFKILSERNSKNRLSDKRCTHTTGNLSFAEVEDTLTKENNNVKPSADIVWLVEHTMKNSEGELQWADPSSKEIHGKLKNVVATSGDSLTQEQILVDVLGARSGYLRGKGTALRGFTKGFKQLAQQKIVEKQQEQLQEQQQKIQDLEKMVEETKQSQQRELEEYKAEQQEAMEALKQELLQTLAIQNV